MKFVTLMTVLLSMTAFVNGADVMQEGTESSVKEKENRLRGVIKEYNTIIIGKAKTVALDEFAPDKEHPWAVDIHVDDVLMGTPIKGNRIKIFIHSPSREFIYDADPTIEIKNRKCVWALMVKDEMISKKEGVFPLQRFTDSDITMLKTLIKEMNDSKIASSPETQAKSKK